MCITVKLTCSSVDVQGGCSYPLYFGFGLLDIYANDREERKICLGWGASGAVFVGLMLFMKVYQSAGSDIPKQTVAARRIVALLDGMPTRRQARSDW